VIAELDGDGRFRPEAELAPFLRMHAKEIAKSLGKCVPIEEVNIR